MTGAVDAVATRHAAPAGGPPGATSAAGGERFAALLEARLHAGPAVVEGAGQPGIRRLRLGEMVAGLAAPGPAAPGFPAPGLAAPGFPAPGLAAPAAAGPVLHAAADDGAGGRVIAAAGDYLGVPYRWGGTDPATGLDCSGFVQRVFADLGVSLPRVSADQSRAGQAVPSLAEARPGDLVYWRGRGGRPNHIGIYAGGGQMIHAPRTGDVVKVDSVRSAPPDAIRRVG